MIGRVLQNANADRPGSIAEDKLLNLVQVQLIRNSVQFGLSIRSGEIVAITGTLGSGKSRLLGALFGLSRIAAGEIFFHGKSWHPAGPSAAISQGVFMAGEDRWRTSLLPPTTPGADIAGTIALPHRRRWFRTGLVRPARERAVAAQTIGELGIRCRSSRDTLDLLSGGNQQKVVIGRWRAEPYRLLLLDEPFQGIDVGARRDLIHAIRSARHGAATLIATSDIEEAIEVADVVAVMRDHTIAGLHSLGSGDTPSLLNAIGAVEAREVETRESFAA
jgi:simple sugar transport system ATP-binding protein